MSRRRRPVVHLRIESAIGSKNATLWCQERTEVNATRNFDTTTEPSKVTCKRCIKAGGCGPSH